MWGDSELWRCWLRSAGASPGTVRLRAHFVDEFAAGHPDAWTVDLDDVVAYLGREGWAPETRKAARASLRSFYRWALLTGRLERDPTTGCPPVRVPAGKPHPAPEDVLAVALARADREGRLILLLGAYAGLRRAEIAALRCADADLGTDRLRVHGKGGVVRLVPIHPKLGDELARCPSRCCQPDWCFPSPRRPGEHVCPDYIYRRARELLDGLTTHTLRHRFATQAYRGSRDLRAVQTLLGHSKPETTARYVAVTADDLVAAVNGVA